MTEIAANKPANPGSLIDFAGQRGLSFQDDVALREYDAALTAYRESLDIGHDFEPKHPTNVIVLGAAATQGA